MVGTMSKSITVILRDAKGVDTVREIPYEDIQDAGVINVPNMGGATSLAEAIALGTYYRFEKIDGAFFNRPVFVECKVVVIA